MQKRKVLKKIIITIVLVLMVACLGLGGYAGIRAIRFNKAAKQELKTSADNVVLMIGDGMGFNHLSVGKAYLEKDELNMEKLGIHSSSRTDSLTMFAPTDSAAGATALSTGHKVYNSNVGRLNGKDLQLITDIAKQQGKGVGIVVTDSLSGATPASFSAHADKRGDSDKIIADQIAGDIDLFIGSGYDEYLPHKDEIEQQGFTFTNLYSGLDLAAERIFATFSSIANDNYTDETPSLTSLAEFAVEFLTEKYPNGFFLMVEGSHIDKRSHKNKIFEMIDYLREFDNTVGAVNQKLAANGKANLLIVTADHETGNLQYNGEKKDEISNKMFKSGGHTAKDVPLFVSSTNPVKIGKVVENIQIFTLMKNAILAN